MEKFVAAVDQGTTGTRCVICDHKGKITAWHYAEHEQIYKRPGWVEHNPLEILFKTKLVIRKAIEKAKINSKTIAAIGVTNQRETAVLWNPKTGKPLHNAIVWQDTRTKDRCTALRRRDMEDTLVHPVTGLYLYPYFSSTKIEWMMKNIRNIRDKIKKGEVVFGNIDSWIIWNLTRGCKDVATPEKNGAHVTDYTNASRTMLMDIRRLQWCPDLLDLFGIPDEIMPLIRPSSDSETYGYTTSQGPFRTEIPVCGDLGDQQAALVGQACFEAGEMKNTYGTGSFLLLNIGEKPILAKHGLLTTIGYGFEEGKCAYALEGSVAITGAAVQWLRDNLALKSTSEIETLAQSVSDVGSSGVYFVPAFSGLFFPYWDLDARGIIVGLTRYTGRAHLAHATLESICWQTKDVCEVMRLQSRKELKALKVDGGAAVNNYLMQLQADILGDDVVRPAITETTALGAVYAAGLAVDFWSNVKELKKFWKIGRVFRPRWEVSRRNKLYQGWKVAVKRAEGWLSEVGELPPSGTIIT